MKELGKKFKVPEFDSKSLQIVSLYLQDQGEEVRADFVKLCGSELAVSQDA